MNFPKSFFNRFFIGSSVCLFMFTGILKVMALLFPFDSHPNAAFSIIPESYVQGIAGLLEVCFAFFLMSDSAHAQRKLIAIFWTGILFIAYHIAIFGKVHKCACLGILSSAHGRLLSASESLSKVILVYLLLGSTSALLCGFQGRQDKM